MTLALVSSMAVATRVHAQAGDRISPFMRRVVTSIVRTGGLERLDSTASGAGVRREIRVYTGFGMGEPNHLTGLWQDDHGAHGRFGLFWTTVMPPTGLAADDKPVPRSKQRDHDTSLRRFIDLTYGCRARSQSRT